MLLRRRFYRFLAMVLLLAIAMDGFVSMLGLINATIRLSVRWNHAF